MPKCGKRATSVGFKLANQTPILTENPRMGLQNKTKSLC